MRSLMLTVALAALASTAGAAELNLYSARHYDSDDALYAAFTAETGIAVNVIEGKGDELMERMKVEGASSPADIFITVDAGNLWRAEEAGLLQPVRSETLDKAIPPILRDDDGHWFGLSKRARVLVLAKDAPADLVTTYEGLAEAALKGEVLIRSSSNVYNQSLVGALLDRLGMEKTESWANGVVANMARTPQGGDTDQIKAVAAGEGRVAVSNHYYLARLFGSDKAEDKAVADKVRIVFPNQDGAGTHVNISGAGVAKHSPNRDNAVRFLEYLTTPQAQEAFASANYEFPIVEGAALNPVIRDWAGFKEDATAAATFGRNNAEALKLMDRAGWR